MSITTITGTTILKNDNNVNNISNKTIKIVNENRKEEWSMRVNGNRRMVKRQKNKMTCIEEKKENLHKQKWQKRNGEKWEKRKIIEGKLPQR